MFESHRRLRLSKFARPFLARVMFGRRVITAGMEALTFGLPEHGLFRLGPAPVGFLIAGCGAAAAITSTKAAGANNPDSNRSAAVAAL
jgi:hypothetical protein